MNVCEYSKNILKKSNMDKINHIDDLAKFLSSLTNENNNDNVKEERDYKKLEIEQKRNEEITDQR